MTNLNSAIEIATTLAPAAEFVAPALGEIAVPVVTEVATEVATAMAPTVAKTVKPGALKSLFRAAKRSPVKATVVVAGSVGVIAGTVYLVKKVRKVRAANAEIEALVDGPKAEAEVKAEVKADA